MDESWKHAERKKPVPKDHLLCNPTHTKHRPIDGKLTGAKEELEETKERELMGTEFLWGQWKYSKIVVMAAELYKYTETIIFPL